MFRKVPIFSGEIAKLLLSIREKARLSQMEVAERMGLSPKSGYTYIERWEKEGLKQDVLLKVRNKVVSVFGNLRLKGMV